MLFSELPPEIIDQILLETVRARGIQRASRLRYVCKSWATLALHAIFRSGILDAIGSQLIRSPNRSFFRSNYLAHEILGTRNSRPLLILRRVAERILKHRYGEPPDQYHGQHTAGSGTPRPNYSRYRECVFRLCEMPYLAMDTECSKKRLDWIADSPTKSISEDDLQFQQALLTAAAGMNEVLLVDQIISKFSKHLYLVCWDGLGGQCCFEKLLGSPVSTAAFYGCNEALLVLKSPLDASDRCHQHFREMLLASAEGNQLHALKVSLKLESDAIGQIVVRALERTTSVSGFQKLLPLALVYLHDNPRYCYETRWLPSRLIRAVEMGNLAMIRYFFDSLETSTPPTTWFNIDYNVGDASTKRVPAYKRDPVQVAARCGHQEVLYFLLARGFRMSSRCLKAAVLYGKVDSVREVVRIMMDDKEDYNFLEVIVAAVEKENEAVVKLLLDRDLLSIQEKAQALQRCQALSLESMEDLLRKNVGVQL